MNLEVLSFEMTPFCENCYVVKDGGEAIVIDPGEASDELLDAVAGSKVVMIFNTHCHIDHAGGNAEMVRATGAPLVCHRADLPLLRGLVQQGAMFGYPVQPSPDPDRFIEEGDEIAVGAVSFKVLHTPGHAPGHVVLVGDGLVIGGDVLFAGSIGRTDLPGGSYEQLLHSIKTKLLPLPDSTIVYSGHGPATTIGAERAGNPFLVGL
ncbi:MAG: MBL fold metallo-hydrolase [Candidatus Hydrogenedentes bacterium]|nr:MBL fold metallo-hydrolase [Candidatus Hydrogenedentota bacterium]